MKSWRTGVKQELRGHEANRQRANTLTFIDKEVQVNKPGDSNQGGAANQSGGWGGGGGRDRKCEAGQNNQGKGYKIKQEIQNI